MTLAVVSACSRNLLLELGGRHGLRTADDRSAGTQLFRTAEGEGFEPPDALTSSAFKADAFGRSANPPKAPIVDYPAKGWFEGSRGV